MPPNAAVAEVAWDPRPSVALKERREIGTARLGRRNKVDAPASEPYVASAAAALLDTGISGRVSPRVFAGFVRFGEFALALGPRVPHRLFLRRRVFPPVRGGPGAGRARSPSRCSRRSASTPSRPAPTATPAPRLLTGWTVTVGATAGDRILSEARARVLAGVAGALVSSAAPSALLTYRAGVAALTGAGLAKGHLTRRAIVYGAGPASRSLIEALDCRSGLRHPRMRRLRRSRRGSDRRIDRRLSQPRQPRRARGLLPPRPHRHAGRGAAGLRRDARARASQEAVGAADRHPAGRATPPGSSSRPRTYSFAGDRAADRHHRPADHRLGRDRQVAVRQERRPDGAGRAGAA